MLGGKIAVVLTIAAVSANAMDWKQSNEKDDFSDNVYNVFTLVSDNTLQDVGVSGQAQIKVVR